MQLKTLFFIAVAVGLNDGVMAWIRLKPLGGVLAGLPRSNQDGYTTLAYFPVIIRQPLPTTPPPPPGPNLNSLSQAADTACAAANGAGSRGLITSSGNHIACFPMRPGFVPSVYYGLCALGEEVPPNRMQDGLCQVIHGATDSLRPVSAATATTFTPCPLPSPYGDCVHCYAHTSPSHSGDCNHVYALLFLLSTATASPFTPFSPSFYTPSLSNARSNLTLGYICALRSYVPAQRQPQTYPTNQEKAQGSSIATTIHTTPWVSG
ncbi:hypothetical protein TWF694_000997 [Orbilia ellipsospora]|uniref:Uncharacterized protein n=1 Tax=Orbilia ellipsospora TaxID=2528407 RepID=A0AAV9XTQ2_9PEZI